MANSGIKHVDIGTELSKTEWEDEANHALVGGTAFPSPATEPQLFYRTDLNCWFIYSGETLGWVALTSTFVKNALINGSMRIAQRGTAFTSTVDDTYYLDRWVLLSDGNNVVNVDQVLRTASGYNGAYAECKLTVVTANKQFGFLNILEAKDSGRLVGTTVSLSFKARMLASDDNTHSLKAVILAWTGTVDTVTSDVVSAWGATPTYVANWTAENVPVSRTLTTTEQTFKFEGIPLDTASTKNIAVFIFCDQTDGVAADGIVITDAQLELGTVCTPFEFRPHGVELLLCQRYYEKTYLQATVPGTNQDTGTWGHLSKAGTTCFGIRFQVMKRAAPTVTIYSKQGTAAKVTRWGDDAEIGTAVTALRIAESGFLNISDAALVLDSAYYYHVVAVSEL